MTYVIETIKEKPEDIYRLFNIFADMLIKHTLWIKGTRMEIREIGSRGRLSSNFRLMMSAGAELNFTVSFDISNDGINILYENKIDFNISHMFYKRSIKKLVTNTVNPEMISLIKDCLNDSNQKNKYQNGNYQADSPINEEEIKFCTMCGIQNPKNSSFCMNCGNEFRGS
jgi:hypothetical protein